MVGLPPPEVPNKVPAGDDNPKGLSVPPREPVANALAAFTIAPPTTWNVLRVVATLALSGVVYPKAAGAEVTVMAVAAKVPSPSGKVIVPVTVPATGPFSLVKEKLKVAAFAIPAEPNILPRAKTVAPKPKALFL